MIHALEAYHKTRFLVKPRPTDIPGLKFFPCMEPEVDHDRDAPVFGWINDIEVSDCNLEVVRKTVSDFGNSLTSIMEIGVNRNGERSMSRILMDNRPPGCFYLGVDLNDKSYLNNPTTNTWTLQTDSCNQEVVRNFLASKGIKKLDLLFIDGWHSVNNCINDWKYSDLLSDRGVVILHDTNSHPGCVGLFEAVSDSYYDKVRYCTIDDQGIAVFRKK
jgi:hypothetical protein